MPQDTENTIKRAVSGGGFLIGVDLGGTKIEGAILDRAGAIPARRRIGAPYGDSSGVRGAAWLWPAEARDG